MSPQVESGIRLSPDRYHDALVRYLEAVASDRSGVIRETPRRKPPATVVGDVMTKAVVAAHEGAVFKEIVDALARNRIRSVPVIDLERRVVGVVSASDLINRVVARPRPHGVRRAHKPLAATAAELMTKPAITTRAHATIVEAAQHAARAGVRMLPVVDAKGVLVGVVTQGDLLRVFLRDDTEIRNEIQRFAAETMHLDSSQLTVEVCEGVVSLVGKLERESQLSKLITRVRAVPGVVDIDNQLVARYDDRYLPAPHEGRRAGHST
jgi:CBS domain-containing protein